MSQEQEDVFRGHGVEVESLDRDAFLKVKETLTRVGVPSREGKRLYQSCHVLHKRGRYSILHFKELFSLDGRVSTMSEEDRDRRDKIVSMLVDWGLIRVVNRSWKHSREVSPRVKVIKYDERDEWELVPKYGIGRRE